MSYGGVVAQCLQWCRDMQLRLIHATAEELQGTFPTRYLSPPFVGDDAPPCWWLQAPCDGW